MCFMSHPTYNESKPGEWLNEYASPDYHRIGDALLEMQPPTSLRDYESLRSMPLPDRWLTRLLDMPIDELIRSTTSDRQHNLLVTADAVVDWNQGAPYFRTRHIMAMGYEGMMSIRGISLSRARRLGEHVAAVCRLAVPSHPSPELSAYVCQDLYDVPAYGVTKQGKAVASSRQNMALESRHGVLFESPNGISMERTRTEVKEFESRFWLAKAIFQATVEGSDYYMEIGDNRDSRE